MSLLNITNQNFDEEVMQSDKPVLIDFWAAWCGPCKMLSGVIDELSQEVTNAKICKINIDENPEIAQAFGVRSIPTLVVLKDGKIENSSVGFQSKDKIIEMLNI